MVFGEKEQPPESPFIKGGLMELFPLCRGLRGCSPFIKGRNAPCLWILRDDVEF